MSLVGQTFITRWKDESVWHYTVLSCYVNFHHEVVYDLLVLETGLVSAATYEFLVGLERLS